MAPRLLVIALIALMLTSLAPAVAAQEGPTMGDGEPVETTEFGFEPLEWVFEQLHVALAESIRAIHKIDKAQRRAAKRDERRADLPAPAKIVRSGPRSSGAVALTFDDGYNAEACARIANTLRRNDAKGTFFINGNYLKAEPAKWKRILAGMPVGNHTRSHHDLTGEPHPVVIKQIRENEALHERILGRPMLKVLRPPYGAYGERVRRIAAQLGYDRIALWSVDTHDWKPTTSARAIVRRATGARPGSVILMHCARNATARALPSIIRHYRARGIELAGLGKVLGS